MTILSDKIKANVAGTDANRGIGTNYSIGTVLETPVKTTTTVTRKQVKVSANKSTAESTFEAKGKYVKQPDLDNTSKVETLKKVNTVPEKRDIPATTPSHLSPKCADTAVPCEWKAMQQLAKEWGVKAGGRGITSDVLHTWLCDFQKLGHEAFAAKHPDAVKKAETKKDNVSSKEVVSNHMSFNGLTFREAQALVKSKGWKVEGVKANSWDGLNKLAATHAK